LKVAPLVCNLVLGGLSMLWGLVDVDELCRARRPTNLQLFWTTVQRRGTWGGLAAAVMRTWKIWYVSLNWMLVQFSIASIIYFNPLIVDAMFHPGSGWRNPAKETYKDAHQQLQHEAKVALISSLLWVPVVIFMLLVAYSSKHFKERNLHCAVPLTIAGVAYMCALLLLLLLKARGGRRFCFQCFMRLPFVCSHILLRLFVRMSWLAPGCRVLPANTSLARLGTQAGIVPVS
jgi:hypothetical protein